MLLLIVLFRQRAGAAFNLALAAFVLMIGAARSHARGQRADRLRNQSMDREYAST
ncbi:MAG: hypothetical protein ACRD2A_05115 [Vicinamibacterales bacterium]